MSLIADMLTLEDIKNVSNGILVLKLLYRISRVITYNLTMKDKILYQLRIILKKKPLKKY